MPRLLFRALFVLLTSLAFFPGSESSAAEISLTEAKHLVETYVAQQGYTGASTSLKPGELEGSSFERTPPDSWLKARHDTIRPRAIAYTTRVRGEKPGWTFGFEYKLPIRPAPEMFAYAQIYYFSVQIGRDGRDILVLHSPLPKKNFQTLKADPKSPR